MNRLFRQIKDWWEEYTEGMKLFPAVVLIFSTVLILVVEQYGSTGFYRRNLHFGEASTPFFKLLPHIYWFLTSFFFYGAVPLGLLLIFRKRPKDFGFALGDWRLGLKVLALFSAVMVVVVLIVLQTKTFSQHYPMNRHALQSLSYFMVYESFHMMYFLGWEFVYRGFMVFALRPVIGNYAIIVQMIPFAILHVGKPAPEAFASILAGLILGAFALRTRSFLYCFLLHAISALALDIGVFLTRGHWIW